MELPEKKLNKLEQQNKQLREENEKLRECVEFYADYTNWVDRNDYYVTHRCQDDDKIGIRNDKDNEKWSFSWHGGKLARQTLKEIDNEQEG